MPRVIELPKFYEDLTIPYIDKRKREVEQLKEYFIEGDFEQIQKSAHKIAGSGGSYGLPDISRIGKKMEEAALANEAMKVKELLEELSEFLSGIDIQFLD